MANENDGAQDTVKARELSKMNRMQLIEVIYALQQNQRELEEENKKLRIQLDDRTIKMSEYGSIAEAALGINEVFEKAQAAADQYVSSVRQAYDGIWKEIIGDRDRLKAQLKEEET
ncbi:MAG: DNA repair protein [Clostridiales bacterium]|nr:DNA repair protein [Clostridiales bacterium]